MRYSPFRERAHDFGVVTDVGGVDTVHLNKITNKLFKKKHPAAHPCPHPSPFLPLSRTYTPLILPLLTASASFRGESDLKNI
jgi:hypothetical protein